MYNFESSDRKIYYWLMLLSLAVICMISIGGITRLTESGLSMTNWKPVTGWLPPLSLAEWNESFQAYTNSPEYQKINYGMTLDKYKTIFWWEYIHRLWGRIIGLLFFIPYFYFLTTKKLSGKQAVWFAGLGILGGLQGVIGWWMVKSGLVYEPRVSHIRLTIHFGTALITLGLLFWSALQVNRRKIVKMKPLRFLSVLILFVTLLTGSWVAGQDAGLVYNTFPTMGGQWVPHEVGFYAPFHQDLLQNPVTAQFIHRVFTISVFVMILAMCIQSLRKRVSNHWSVIVMILACLQVILGISTLLTQVNLYLAVLHQLVAVLLFMSFIAYNNAASKIS